jgi:hypothetical protein
MFTIADMLELNPFKGAKIIAGRSALNSRVRFVDFIEVPDVTKWVLKDAFYFTTGYAFREKPKQICRIIEAFSKNGAAGLGIKVGRYIDEIPEEAIRIAEKLNFPLVILPISLAYAVAARTVMWKIFCAERNKNSPDWEELSLFRSEEEPQDLLTALEHHGWNRRQTVWYLQWKGNPSARPHVLSLRPSQYSSRDSLRMITAAFPDESKQDFLDFLKEDMPTLVVKEMLGISGPSPLSDLAQGFGEATCALECGAQLGFDAGIFVYSDLELLGLIKKGASPEKLHEAAVRLLRPLLEEDKKNILILWKRSASCSGVTALQRKQRRNFIFIEIHYSIAIIGF